MYYDVQEPDTFQNRLNRASAAERLPLSIASTVQEYHNMFMRALPVSEANSTNYHPE